MPKYWGKQIFTHGRFPEVGQKQKTEREKKREKRRDRTMVITMAKIHMVHASQKERKRLNDGNNTGQATHGTRKHTWRTQAAWAKNLQEVSPAPGLVLSKK